MVAALIESEVLASKSGTKGFVLVPYRVFEAAFVSTGRAGVTLGHEIPTKFAPAHEVDGRVKYKTRT